MMLAIGIVQGQGLEDPKFRAAGGGDPVMGADACAATHDENLKLRHNLLAVVLPDELLKFLDVRHVRDLCPVLGRAVAIVGRQRFDHDRRACAGYEIRLECHGSLRRAVVYHSTLVVGHSDGDGRLDAVRVPLRVALVVLADPAGVGRRP